MSAPLDNLPPALPAGTDAERKRIITDALASVLNGGLNLNSSLQELAAALREIGSGPSRGAFHPAARESCNAVAQALDAAEGIFSAAVNRLSDALLAMMDTKVDDEPEGAK